MLMIGIASLGLGVLFGNAPPFLHINDVLQQAAQYAQECGEQTLATRHNLGFAAVSSVSCGNDPVGYSRVVIVGDVYYGGLNTACPNTLACRNISITVSRINQPELKSSITLMLADY